MCGVLCSILIYYTTKNKGKQLLNQYHFKHRKRTATLYQNGCPFLVPMVGVEPTRYCYHGILSPARLPIPPHRRKYCLTIIPQP